MWCGSHAGLGWAGWTLMSVGMVAFWGLIIWAIVTLLRGVGGGDGPLRRPADVLADRLASGQIGADEYERTRDLLEADTEAGRPDSAMEARR